MASTLEKATEELELVIEGDGRTRVDQLSHILNICKNFNKPSDWDPPNNVSIRLLKIIRLFLVDRDRAVRLNGARAIRYLTWDRSVLLDIIKVNIPILMCRCLERESEEKKYFWERMQAFKWARHIMDIAPMDVPRCVVMSLIAIVGIPKDEFKSVALDTLRELALKNPQLVAQCNGIKAMIDVILDSSLKDSAHTYTLTLLYMIDHPSTRRYLRPSLDIRALLAPFWMAEPVAKVNMPKKEREVEEEAQRNREVVSHKTLMTMFKSVTGILYLASDPYGLKPLVELIRLPSPVTALTWARKRLFDVLEQILQPLSDNKKIDDARGPNLIVNYIVMVLIAFIKNGLIESLEDVGLRHDNDLAPRARVLLGRIQWLAARFLPKALCDKVCNVKRVVSEAALFHYDPLKHQIQYGSKLGMTVSRNFANNMLIELSEPMDSGPDETHTTIDQDRIQALHLCQRLGPTMDLNSTFIRYRYQLSRDIPSLRFQDRIPYHTHQKQTEDKYSFSPFAFQSQRATILEDLKTTQNASYQEVDILNMLKKSGIVSTKDFMLWDMDEVWKILNGPLWHLPNLQTAFRHRFVKRILSYLRPSKTSFSMLKWTANTFRHAQCAVQLFRIMTNYDEGCENQYFKETVAEIFDALKDQIDCNLSGKRPKLAHAPLSRRGVTETLSRVYLILIGILSESERGMKFVESHKLFEFCIGLGRKEISGSSPDRIVGPNDYLLRLLAINLDYSQDQKNLRILFSTLVATGSQFLRKTLISHLELLYRAQIPGYDQWSIDVLGIMLNKGNQELALTALKVLEKINVSQGTAKARSYLDNLVKTKPTDQMVGNYGQFLFAKLLSTSNGLEYLEQSKWVDRKRFEWITVFNQRYTLMLETALMTAVNKDPQSIAAQFLKAAVTESEAANTTSTTTIIIPQEEIKEKEQEKEQEKGKSKGKGKEKEKEKDFKATEISSSEMADWLPYHLIHEHKTEEEELYHEYLSYFPWTLSVEILYNTGQEKSVVVECFFDYHCFLPPPQGQKYQKPLGPGIYGIILDNYGKPEPFFVEKNAKVRIRLNIGFGCLDDIHSQTVTEKTVELSDTQKYSDDFTLYVDEPVYFFLEPGPVDKNGKRDPKHNYLSRVFFSVKEEQQSHSLVRPLPHFYGELAKTEKGCEYIEKTGDIKRFFTVVSNAMKNNSSNLSNSSSNFLNLRAALWALGMIGSSNTGLQLLQKYKDELDIVKEIAEMALRFPTLSVRGTCLYVLGLFSRTNEGTQQLSTLGFDFPADNVEDQLSIAIPKNLDEFFDISETDYCKPFALTDFIVSCYSPPSLAKPMSMKPVDPNELLGERGRTEETILAHVAALCCHVTQKSSLHALLKIHSKKPSVFSNPVLYRECLKLITTYNYNLKVRRFILFQLFDGVMLDNNTIDILDVDMNTPIVEHREIRQWRYNYKAKVLVKKRQEKKLKEAQKDKEPEKTSDDITEQTTEATDPADATEELPEGLLD